MDNTTKNIRLSLLLYLLVPALLFASCFVLEERTGKERDINKATIVTNARGMFKN